MSYRASVFEVMIASPGDVPEERGIIQSTLLNWNSEHSRANQLVLQPVMWETHAAPDLAGRAQELINRRTLDFCDLLVGVFWTRLGTPTGEHESGTVEEIKSHVAAGRPAMVYFSSRPVIPGSYSEEQFKSVLEFQSWCQENGLVGRFDDTAEFSTKFSRDLSRILRDNPYLASLSTVVEETIDNAGDGLETVTLPAKAATMLLAAADGTGMVTVMRALNGTHYSAGGTEFVHDGSRKEIAEMEHAVNKLESFGLIRDRGFKGEIFEVTHEGFQAISRNGDMLAKFSEEEQIDT